MANNIYSILDWVGGSFYKKNAVAKVGSFYYYSINTHTASLSFDGDLNAGLWGGAYNDEFGIKKPQFIWTPSYGTSVDNQPKVKIIKFGDGYEQRLKDGINNNLIKVKLTFDKRDEDESFAILHFLYARQGTESFIFIPQAPYASAARFVARAWTDNKIFFNNHTVQTEFEQVVN